MFVKILSIDFVIFLTIKNNFVILTKIAFFVHVFCLLWFIDWQIISQYWEQLSHKRRNKAGGRGRPPLQCVIATIRRGRRSRLPARSVLDHQRGRFLLVILYSSKPYKYCIFSFLTILQNHQWEPSPLVVLVKKRNVEDDVPYKSVSAHNREKNGTSRPPFPTNLFQQHNRRGRRPRRPVSYNQAMLFIFRFE